jgi:hypothetical protein
MTESKTYSREELLAMEPGELVKIVGEAKAAGATFHGTGVVRKADGTIRYAPDAIPGTYHEEG